MRAVGCSIIAHNSVDVIGLAINYFSVILFDPRKTSGSRHAFATHKRKSITLTVLRFHDGKSLRDIDVTLERVIGDLIIQVTNRIVRYGG